MKIAYSNLACPEWSLQEVFSHAVNYGYDGVELRLLDGDIIPSDIDATTQKKITEMARRNSIDIVALGASTRFAMVDPEERKRNVDELLRYVELASRMEVPIVRTFGGGANSTLDNDPNRVANYVNWVAESLNQVSKRAEELGVQVLLETHDEFSSSYLVAQVLGLVSSSAIGALWDVHHPYRMGETVDETFDNLHDRLRHVHVKDARRNGDGWDLVLLGEGEIPVSYIVSKLKKSGYDQYLCVEWERKWHPEIEDAHVALPKHIEILREYVAHKETK